MKACPLRVIPLPHVWIGQVVEFLKFMVWLHSILGVSVDDDFHDFAIEYLGLRRKREMGYSIGSTEQKLKWLQRIYAQSRNT